MRFACGVNTKQITDDTLESLFTFVSPCFWMMTKDRRYKSVFFCLVQAVLSVILLLSREKKCLFPQTLELNSKVLSQLITWLECKIDTCLDFGEVTNKENCRFPMLEDSNREKTGLFGCCYHPVFE